MLFAFHIVHFDLITFCQRRKAGLDGADLIIQSFLINGSEAGKLLVFAVEAKSHLIPGHLHGHGFVQGRHHLTGQEAIVDQTVQIVLFLGQRCLDLFRRAPHIRGTDSLMSILCIFLALILNGLFRQIFRTEPLRNVCPQGGHGLFADAYTVGTDVAYNTLGSFAFNVHAFVKLLHHLHGFGCGKA